MKNQSKLYLHITYFIHSAISGPKGETGNDGAPGPVGPIGPQGAPGERYYYHTISLISFYSESKLSTFLSSKIIFKSLNSGIYLEFLQYFRGLTGVPGSQGPMGMRGIQGLPVS